MFLSIEMILKGNVCVYSFDVEVILGILILSVVIWKELRPEECSGDGWRC